MYSPSNVSFNTQSTKVMYDVLSFQILFCFFQFAQDEIYKLWSFKNSSKSRLEGIQVSLPLMLKSLADLIAFQNNDILIRPVWRTVD